MTKRFHLVLLFAVIFSLVTGCSKSTNSSTPSSDAVVTGTVTVSSAAPLSSPVIAVQKQAMRAQASGDIVPVPGAVCTIEGTDKKDTTDGNGHFEIAGVSFGTHLLICTKTLADGNSYSFLEVIDVAEGSTTDIGTLEITLGGKIQGTAIMEGKTDQSGIKVFIPGTSYQAQTDSAGSYLIKNVPAGSYQLQFEHAGFKTVTLSDITVSSGETCSASGVMLTVDTGPTGTVSINNDDAYSQSRTVTLSITASAEALLMMISEDPDFVGTNWQTIAASMNYTFDSDGSKRLFIKFSNENGLASGTVSDDIIVDTAAPSGAAIVINDNAATVNTTSVTLTLSATDAATAVGGMMIGNDPGFAGAAWELFSNTRAWTLSDGNGTRTVYVKFRDSAGNETQAVSASILLDTSTPAAGGIIDAGFGANGKVYLHVGDVSAFLFSVAVQTDGKIVAGGYSYYFTGSSYNIQFLVVRFNSNGSLDTSFGNGNGMVTTNFGYWGAIAALAIQPDGKIVAAGNVSGGFGVARYNTDGSPDSSFGTNGIMTTSAGSSCYALALQSDGKIVLGGSSGGGMVVVRLTTGGALDSTFNGTGLVKTNAGTGWNEIYALTLQGDGKIVAGGYAYTADGCNFAVLRYNTNGSLDTTFGTGGKVTTWLGSYARINSLALQADGKIVAGGMLATSELGGNHWIVAMGRYNSDGSLDSTFGSGGIVTTDAVDWRSEIQGIAVTPTGEILATGYAGTITAQTDFFVFRYKSDGSLDTSFGTNGVVITDIAGDADNSNAITVQSDGKIIAAGSAFFDTATGITLVRYLP